MDALSRALCVTGGPAPAPGGPRARQHLCCGGLHQPARGAPAAPLPRPVPVAAAAAAWTWAAGLGACTPGWAPNTWHAPAGARPVPAEPRLRVATSMNAQPASVRQAPAGQAGLPGRQAGCSRGGQHQGAAAAQGSQRPGHAPEAAKGGARPSIHMRAGGDHAAAALQNSAPASVALLQDWAGACMWGGAWQPSHRHRPHRLLRRPGRPPRR